MNELTSPADPAEPAEAAAQTTDGGASTSGENASQRRSRSRHAGQVLDQQQCLTGLSQLPGMLALGLLKPAQANAMRGAFKDLLDHHREDRQPASGAVATEDLLEAVRKNPALLTLIEPLLTDEQFDTVMNAINGAPHGEA